MNPSTATIPVLRFWAGELPLGMVAAAVAELSGLRPGFPHIATVLRLQRLARAPQLAPLPGLPRAADPAGQRLVSLLVSGQGGGVIVDGPVEFTTVGVKDLVPTAPLVLQRLHPALAFARDRERIVCLLDVTALLKELNLKNAT